MSILLLNIYKYLGTFCEEKGRLSSVDLFFFLDLDNLAVLTSRKTTLGLEMWLG